MSQEKNNSLSDSYDKKLNSTLIVDVPELTKKQTKRALEDLNVFRYPTVERKFIDPPVNVTSNIQNIGLVSFIPAKGATPNEKGIYGFAKLRGNFDTEHDAQVRAETLIRTVDSYHQIYHVYVGQPFPLTTSSDYSKEIDRVELNKQLANSVSNDVKQKREQEQKDIEDIKDREKQLLEDVKQEEQVSDRYTTLRVKKAQLIWTYLETEKKMKQMKVLIAKARKELEELDEKQPELKETYYKKYLDARKSAGLSVEPDATDQSFMRYLVEDVHVPALEEEYNLLYKNN